MTIVPVEHPANVPAAMDTQARRRIDDVTTKLLNLVGRLETRIANLERQVRDHEQALHVIGARRVK